MITSHALLSKKLEPLPAHSALLIWDLRMLSAPTCVDAHQVDGVVLEGEMRVGSRAPVMATSTNEFTLAGQREAVGGECRDSLLLPPRQPAASLSLFVSLLVLFVPLLPFAAAIRCCHSLLPLLVPLLTPPPSRLLHRVYVRLPPFRSQPHNLQLHAVPLPAPWIVGAEQRGRHGRRRVQERHERIRRGIEDD